MQRPHGPARRSESCSGPPAGPPAQSTVGAAARWAINGGLNVGNSGTGSLAINGGTVQTTGAFAEGDLSVGGFSGGIGVVSIGSIGLLGIDGNVDLGGSQSGSLTIAAGGSLAVIGTGTQTGTS